VVADAAPSIIFAERCFEGVIGEAVEQLSFDAEVVPFESVTSESGGLSTWLAGKLGPAPDHKPTGEDIALIAYTSGTTGHPKGAMVRQEAFDLAFLSDDLEPTIVWDDQDVAMMAMPNFHLAGSWVPLPALYHGGTVAMLPTFEPYAYLDAVETYRPTVACLVPTAIQSLLDCPNATRTDFSSLRTLIYAGSPMPVTTIDRAISVIGCELRQFYGTTESYIVTILRPDDHTSKQSDIKSSCGKPIPLVQVRLVDPEGQDVEDGQIGHLIVRSPMLMAGYHGKAHESSEVIRDGWYWTGDLGYMSPSGHYFLVDRAKDLIVTGGENVYSVEVERALERHPSVAVAAVVGIPDARWVEAVTAFVIPKSGAVEAASFAAELRDHCRQFIASYKVPKSFHFVDYLPMTPSGKIRKQELRKLAAETLAETR